MKEMPISRSCGGIVIGDRGMIVLVRHRNAAQWLFPKGHVDGAEDDEEAARREIAEEAGLTNLEYIDDLGSYQRPRILPDGNDSPNEMKEIHMFLFAAPMDNTLTPSMEIEEAKWIPLPHVINAIGHPRDRAWFTTVFERVRHAVQRD